MGPNTPKKPSKTQTAYNHRKAPTASVQKMIDNMSAIFFASLDLNAQSEAKPADLMRKFFNALKNFCPEVLEVDPNSLVCTVGLGKACYTAMINHQTNLKRKMAQDNRKEVSATESVSGMEYASEEASVDKNQPDAESAKRSEPADESESESAKSETPAPKTNPSRRSRRKSEPVQNKIKPNVGKLTLLKKTFENMLQDTTDDQLKYCFIEVRTDSRRLIFESPMLIQQIQKFG